MSFSNFFIKRPIFATVLAVIMVLAGLMTVKTLPIAQFPDITPPTVMVSTAYPGADAETMARTVAAPIEEQVNGVQGMMYMSSNCASGNYSLTITFEPGTDVDIAAVDVQNRISGVQSQLPEPVIQQGVNVRKESGNQVMFMAIESTDPERYDALYLTNYAQLKIVDPLTRVKGVGSVGAFGGGEYDMRVWLDPAAMKERGVTPDEISAAISSQNLDISAGSVGEAPGAGNAQFTYTLTAQGRLKTAEEFGNVIIRTDGNGILRLRDVAKVELGSTSYSQVAQVNGKQCALIGISQSPGANAINVSDGVKAEMKRLSQYFPEGVTYLVIMDATSYVHESINEVLVTFVETTLIVMIVILLFLQNWRAVIIPMLTIPVSLIATFAVMKLMGFSLNTLTLFGLVLAIAIVVDDAIVVVEDCARLVDEGKLNRKQCAEKAMSELTGPVVGEVLVLMSVFIPTAFISGITGSLYKQFALTIAVSTAFSGFNALTLTPALCGLFLTPRKPAKNIIYKAFNKGYTATMNLYERVMTFILRHAGWALCLFIGVAGACIYGFATYPSSYLPEEDMGYFMASVELPTGASLERTNKVMNTLSEEFKKEIPAIKDVMSVSGQSFMGGGSDANMGSFFIILEPWKKRGKKEGVEEVMAQVTEIAYRVQQEAVFFAVNPPSIPGLGSTSGLSLQLLDINSLGATQLASALRDVEDAALKNPKIAKVNSMFEPSVPQYSVKVDRDLAAMRGLSVEDVYQGVSSYFGSSYVGTFVDFGRIFDITMRAEGRDRADIDAIYNLSFRNSAGDMVPFSAVGEVVESNGVPSVSRYNMYTTASLTAIPASGVGTSEAIKAMEDIVNQTLGKNFSYAWSGIAYQETNASTTISFVFIFAIIMTLLVLAAQYESWTDPMAVVLAMPIAVLGCLLGVVFMRQSVGIYTQIGLILLLGMAAKNAILIVEYAMDFRKAGVPVIKAAHDAGVIRFRPIMMTALAFIFGVMPMMFATGAGAGSRKEIGTAIVFGMAVNAIVGTLMVPTFWKVLQDFYEKRLANLLKVPATPSTSQGLGRGDTDTQSDSELPTSV